MIDKERVRFLVHIRLGKDVPTKERLIQTAPKIQAILREISNDEFKLAWTSADGGSFGYFLKTSLDATGISKRLISLGRYDQRDNPLHSDDSMIIIELGKDLAGCGFSQGWTWLQHH